MSSATDPTKLLWHYTTWPAFHSILTTTSFWASVIGFMNDLSETSHAVDVVVKRLRSRFEGQYCPLAPEVIAHMEHVLDLFSGRTCLISFSEKFDDLSQWRAYSPSGQAPISLGFERDAIGAHVESEGGTLDACIYDDSLKEAKLAGIADQVSWDGNPKYLKPLGKTISRAQQQFLQIASFVKHSAFAGECEWRSVFPIQRGVVDGWGFHQSMGVPTPHKVVPWKDPLGKLLGLRHVLVGPHPHQEKVMTSVDWLLRSYQNPVVVCNSKIPYRNW
jgi:hypothetical protein